MKVKEKDLKKTTDKYIKYKQPFTLKQIVKETYDNKGLELDKKEASEALSNCECLVINLFFKFELDVVWTTINLKHNKQEQIYFAPYSTLNTPIIKSKKAFKNTATTKKRYTVSNSLVSKIGKRGNILYAFKANNDTLLIRNKKPQNHKYRTYMVDRSNNIRISPTLLKECGLNNKKIKTSFNNGSIVLQGV